MAGNEATNRGAVEYDKWAEHYNDQAGSSQQQVVKSEVIVRVLVLRWSEIVRVAKNKISLQEAQEQHLEQLKAASGPLGLVGINVIALTYGLTGYRATDVPVRQKGFPVGVAMVAKRPKRA
jgi:hypothetical protein